MRLLTLVLLVISFIFAEGAIPVSIYYESLCYDSVKFITRQLYPNYRNFKQYVTLDFVPYGKSMHAFNKTTGKYTFSCHHGRAECKGNKFQACALSQIDNQDLKLDFVTCVMSGMNPSNVFYIETCATKYNINFRKIVRCALSSEGDRLLAKHGDKTWNLEPNIFFVPTVVYNNSVVINEDDQNKSMENLKQVLCNKISEDTQAPEICD